MSNVQAQVRSHEHICPGAIHVCTKQKTFHFGPIFPCVFSGIMYKPDYVLTETKKYGIRYSFARDPAFSYVLIEITYYQNKYYPELTVQSNTTVRFKKECTSFSGIFITTQLISVLSFYVPYLLYQCNHNKRNRMKIDAVLRKLSGKK